MTLKQSILEKLIKQGEGEKLDFKQRITDKHKVAKTIASFANNKGGIILVGIKDDKTLVYIDPEEEKYMINEASEFFCEPPVLLDFEELEDEETGLIILMVEIPESINKPHASKHKDNEWKIYLRQNDKSLLASALNISLMKKGITESTLSPPLSAIENHLIDYLKSNEHITVKQFMKLVNISKRRALRILTGMVLNGLIKVHDLDKENFYTM